jgi:hypothetical protein
LAILSCSFCKTFPAVQDCSKLYMLSLACCAKKTSCVLLREIFWKGIGTEWLSMSVWPKVWVGHKSRLQWSIVFVSHLVFLTGWTYFALREMISFNVTFFFFFCQGASFHTSIPYFSHFCFFYLSPCFLNPVSTWCQRYKEW